MELDQDVHITVRSGLVARHGAKEGERRDAKALFELLPVGGEKAEHLVQVYDQAPSGGLPDPIGLWTGGP